MPAQNRATRSEAPRYARADGHRSTEPLPVGLAAGDPRAAWARSGRRGVGDVLFRVGDATYPFIAIQEGEVAILDAAGNEIVRHAARRAFSAS